MIILANDTEEAFLRFVNAYPDSIAGKRDEIARIAISTDKIRVLESIMSQDELRTNR